MGHVLIAAARLNLRLVQCFDNQVPSLSWGADAL